VAGVERDEHPGQLLALVLDRMPVALGDVPDVALAQRLDAIPPVRAEQRHIDLAFEHILPFVRVGVPVQLAEAARIQFQDHAGDGL
jgi:hypothetical protein